MSFSHPRGTRGRAMPRGPVMRLVNKLATRRVRGTGGQAMGMDLLVLHTVGRKSGEERTTPLARFSAPDGGWYVVASANGAVENPAWYLNMAAHPDRVSVELDGQRFPIDAEELHGDDRAAAWDLITREVPRFTKYEEKTDRLIPVVRLRRRG